MSVGWSAVIISYKVGKLHFHATIGALISYYKVRTNCFIYLFFDHSLSSSLFLHLPLSLLLSGSKTLEQLFQKTSAVCFLSCRTTSITTEYTARKFKFYRTYFLYQSLDHYVLIIRSGCHYDKHHWARAIRQKLERSSLKQEALKTLNNF